MPLKYLWICLFLFACGTPQKKSPATSEPENETVVISTTPPAEVTPAEPSLPSGAVTAHFKSGELPYYAFVQQVDRERGVTTIAFQDRKAPSLRIPETYGAELEVLTFPEFKSDLLLVTAQLKDPIFNKYYLYILKEDGWKPVVNPFALHKSHVNDTLQPIIVDPEVPGHMFRYYSVFDLDKESELGYTWRLLNERIPIENQ